MIECWFDSRGFFDFSSTLKKFLNFFSLRPPHLTVLMSVTIEGLRSVSVKQAHFLIDKSVFEILTQIFLIRMCL